MASKTKKARARSSEMDSVYLLKLALFLILGSQWLYLVSANGSQLPIPVGVIVGALFASHDHFRIDRKIEYAILLVAMFVGYWLPMGITIAR